MFDFGILRFQIEVRKNEDGEVFIGPILDLQASEQVKNDLNSIDLKEGTYFIKLELNEKSMNFVEKDKELERGVLMAISRALNELRGNNSY
jgi:hypothetical protein